MLDSPGTVDPRAVSRLDAVPGSLVKASLFAALSLGIATYVSVSQWLARRASAKGVVRHRCGGQSKKPAPSGGRAVAVPSLTTSSLSGTLAAAGGAGATARSGSTDASAGIPPSCSDGLATSPTLPQRPVLLLPPRNYFTARAALHVKRHSAKLMEWCDAQLGIQLPFSPNFFELTQEERQAPLILLTFRTVREPSHRMAVTIEELYAPQSATLYAEASLHRVADCASIVGNSTTTTRIGSHNYPAAEYCYVDAQDCMNCVFAIFVTNERVAVTVQYVAPTRVRSVMPTAVYDLVRFLAFLPPAPSPSYLLISEPRLGLGYHLPLDFLIHEGLAEGDGVEDRLYTSRAASSGGVPPPPSIEVALGMAGSPRGGRSPSLSLAQDRGGGGDGHWMVPYATAMGRSGRPIGLLTSYEPADSALTADSLSGMAAPRDGGGEADVAAAKIPSVWRRYLERQVCQAIRQLGFVLGGSYPRGDNGDPEVIFEASHASHPPSRRPVLRVEPYPLSIGLKGNFSMVDDVQEEDRDAVALVTAFSVFQEVWVDGNSTYRTLLPDALDTAGHTWRAAEEAEAPIGTFRAYWSAFYIPVGASCVSFHFVAPVGRYASTDVASFSAAVLNSVSLGNHHGQGVSVWYCNTRHDALPFRLLLPPTGMAAVEEPMLADPLCVVHVTCGVEKVSVTVRVCPFFYAAAGVTTAATERDDRDHAGGTRTLMRSAAALSGSGASSAAASGSRPFTVRPAVERRGVRQHTLFRQLQCTINYFLSQYPGGVHLVLEERTVVSGMPAIRLCFRPLWRDGVAEGGMGPGDGHGDDDDDDTTAAAAAATLHTWNEAGSAVAGGGGSVSQTASDWVGAREAMLEDEVGQFNPFASYLPPPPPPASYLWGQLSSLAPLPPDTAGKSASATSATAKSGTFRRLAGTTSTGEEGGAAALAAGEGQQPQPWPRSPLYAARGPTSRDSQEALDNPLRVALAVCCEGNAVLFQTTASDYTMGTAMEAVQTLATYLAPVPRA